MCKTFTGDFDLDDHEKDDNDRLIAYLKNNRIFMNLLRGSFPEPDVERAKKRLFEKIRSQSYNGTDHTKRS